MSTTDLHMNLTSHDYCTGRADPTVGLTRTASLIAAARAEAARTGALALLFDNGDSIQGTPLGDFARENPDRAHPLMRAAAYLHYDAMGLGNHDFNFGLRVLDAALQQAPCPVVCSNMSRRDPSNAPDFTHFAILDRIVRTEAGESPIRIGVLSFLPPQTMRWDSGHLTGKVDVQNIVDSARTWLPRLAQADCDLVVALAHTGLGPPGDSIAGETEAASLAALDGIDAVIAGHTHLLLPGPDHEGLPGVDAAQGLVHGKPMVMAGFAGTHLGLIDLGLEATAEGCWRVVTSACELRPISERLPDGTARALVPEDEGLVAVLAEDHADTREMMEQPVGRNSEPLHSYFTFFAPDRSLALVAAAQAAALRPRLAGTPGAGLPVLSAVAPGKFGARAGPDAFTDVPPGPLRLRHLADLHVFPNDLNAVIVNGDQLIDWLEMSASLFHRITPGAQGARLVDPAVPGHDFDVIYGLTYEIDISREARFNPDGSLRCAGIRRTRNVAHEGQPVTPDMRFAVAVNSHRASGGGRVAALADAPRIALASLPIRQLLRDYVALALPRDPIEEAPHPWRFAPLPGTVVSVQTGPGAAKHLSELQGLGVEPRGLDPRGFLHLCFPL